jgi:hypothetical protein
MRNLPGEKRPPNLALIPVATTSWAAPAESAAACGALTDSSCETPVEKTAVVENVGS